MIGEEPEWVCYDRWGTQLPEGKFAAAVGPKDFAERILPKYGGPKAVDEWRRLMRRVLPLGEAIFGLPAAAVREDAFAAATLGLRYFGPLSNVLSRGGGPKLSGPFKDLLDEEGIRDPFILRWLDMICFLLQGTTTGEAPTTLMAYMLADFYAEGSTLDYPVGGSKGIVDALARGIEKHNGEIRTRCRVDRIIVENDRAVGVVARGLEIRAPVVACNADPWTARTLAPELAGYLDSLLPEPCPSFLHLHLGIDARGIDESIPPQWASLADWDVKKPRNLALVSVASKLDPTLAPPGKHVVHAYVPATEPFDPWLDSSSDYQLAKARAVDVLWRAIEAYIPDVRARVQLQFAATPLTHRRFLNRHRGTYGAFLKAPNQLMGHKTPISGLFLCGDSTFPGIGANTVEV
ncbi:hypothetical protein CTAYLR_000734 [Chrysophaeum taylorii]|uniref:Amine oxidase domain-containing protein n=1 Tax=Chrysophaeum taylorii TaxID=2483200 RepID=A0AAD7U9L0_9STRA|nr:hypothetical protein CTAYLR_000734 [Chrysophaeum taylorii]